MWQELCVVISQAIPVHAVHILVVETLLLLTVDAVEHILSLGCQVKAHLAADRDAGESTCATTVFTCAATEDKHILHLLIPLERSAHAAVEYLVAAITQVELPNIVRAVVRHCVEELLALLVHCKAAERARARCKTHDAILDVLKLNNNVLRLLLLWLCFRLLLILAALLVLILFSLLLLGFCFLLFGLLLCLLVELILLLAHTCNLK